MYEDGATGHGLKYINMHVSEISQYSDMLLGLFKSVNECASNSPK